MESTPQSSTKKTKAQESAGRQLLRAIKYSKMDAFETALRKGADPNACGIMGKTALMMAVSQNTTLVLPMAKRLIEAGARTDVTDDDGYTPLMNHILRTKAENSDVLEFLLTHGGSNPNAIAPHTADTPLIISATFGHLDYIKILLEHGANLQWRDHQGWNALVCASANGHTEIVEFLLNQGIDHTVQDHRDGKTAIDIARDNLNEDIVRILERHALRCVSVQEAAAFKPHDGIEGLTL